MNLYFISGILWFISGLISHNPIFIPIGCMFIVLALDNSKNNSKNNGKEKENPQTDSAQRN